MKELSAYRLKLWIAPEAIIQSIIRDVSTSRKEPIWAAEVSGAEPAAFVDGKKKDAAASKIPGIPATKNAARQPYSFATEPLTKKLNAIPSGSPSIKMLIARAPCSGGKTSPISAVAAGANDASPTPAPVRIAHHGAYSSAMP